ncbi:YifB family Mg chelatase-like AAA ATPase [Agromyces atrinae]|uniref:ATP-binding protein n=1 Tax=Agromyces atrinae TaxID=592376 RepID=A0A4Q2M7D4_9MICO|nr:YifB family Mg chelatase-like AAA ATPase [Agromyces atrinae]NYD66556.1 magnesium chelatase family protein [Agromyces atrinae]RXZ87227.1 ATP-binding protein [Agromyces atrinae]
MAVARTKSVALLGLEGSVIDVEADLSSQLPGLSIIGLPDAALAESRDRVRSAAKNAGCPLPARKLTVNLSPASLPKHGSGFDLAVALACLAAAGEVSAESIAGVVHLGELGLDGRVRRVRGVLPAVVAAVRAGFTTVMVPSLNRAEAELVPGVRVIGVSTLGQAAVHHGATIAEAVAEVGDDELAPAEEFGEDLDGAVPELADIAGNAEAVEALLAVAAGGHHAFLLGPPGAGKTMLASRLPGILPDLDSEGALEVTSLRSLSDHPIGDRLARRPPFEAPHHTATAASIVGGGSRLIKPGAAARASRGVLFLDEAPEFPAAVLDVLRQPLESGVITIHRANAIARFPARFQLVLAANPCPCGQYGARDGECTCPPVARRRYLARISGPLLDRVDVQMRVPRLTMTQLRLADGSPRLTTSAARARVVAARAVAAERLSGTPWRVNSEVPGPWLRGEGRLHPGGTATRALDRALENGAITMRGYDRVLKLSWTLADVDGSASPGHEHIGRALFLRKGIAA